MRFDISTRGWCLWLPFENPPLLPPSRLPGDLARLVGWRLLQDGVLNKVSLVMERRARFLRTTGSGVTSNEPPDEASWAAKEGLQTIARSALTEIAGLFQELRQLLSTILLATPEERWSVPFAGSPTPALGGSGEHVMMLTDLLLSVARVSVVAAYALKTFVAGPAKTSLFAEPAALQDGNIWKPVVGKITAVWAAVAASVGPASSAKAVELEQYNTTPSVGAMRAWLERASRTGPVWATYLAAASVKLAEEAAADVVKVTPAYKHFLTDKIHPTMVRKNLLAEKVREPLQVKTKILNGVLKAAKAAIAVAKAAAAPDDDTAEGQSVAIKGSQNVYSAAKDALAVIGCCAVVLEDGPDRVQQAIALTAKERPEVPAALWEAVKRVASGAAASAGPAFAKVDPKAELTDVKTEASAAAAAAADS